MSLLPIEMSGRQGRLGKSHRVGGIWAGHKGTFLSVRSVRYLTINNKYKIKSLKQKSWEKSRLRKKEN